MTVQELTEQLSEQELTEWVAYYRIEPFGEQRADIRTASLCATIANCNRDPKKKPSPYTLKDFLLYDESRFYAPKKQSVDQIKALLMQLANPKTEVRKKKKTSTSKEGGTK